MATPPRWETKTFPRGENAGELVMLASGRAGDAATDIPVIHQDAALFAGPLLGNGQVVTHQTVSRPPSLSGPIKGVTDGQRHCGQ